MSNSYKLSALNIVKRYENTLVLDDVSINVESSQFYALLGPSGSGKTTLLRIIAGFVKPDSGKITIDGKDITEQPPNKRNTAMVFQNFSLWPHMNVFENVAFGLRIKKLPPDIIKEKVMDALKMVHLQQHMIKKPQQLSGGQQQRVALARALVVNPEILLLDEPLSNLDASLRDELRQEIKSLQRKMGITTIYVTHDQKEAMYLADIIAVMFDGKIVESNSPENLYRKPQNLKTARFLGKLNELSGIVKDTKDKKCIIETPAGNFIAETIHSCNIGENVIVCFRPEFVQYPVMENVSNRFECRIVSYDFSGSNINVVLERNKTIFNAAFSPSLFKPAGIEKCTIGIDERDIMVFKAQL